MNAAAAKAAADAFNAQLATDNSTNVYNAITAAADIGQYTLNLLVQTNSNLQPGAPYIDSTVKASLIADGYTVTDYIPDPNDLTLNYSVVSWA